MRNFKLKKYDNQAGMASLIVVLVLTVVITMVSLGFVRLMDRAIRQSSENSISSAADYAAKAGVNELASYIKVHANDATAVQADHCNDLIGTGKPLADRVDLSGDGVTEYTCVLVDPVVKDLVFRDAQPYTSRLVKLNTTTDPSKVKKIMVSWQSVDVTHRNLEGVGTQPLQNVTDWSNAKKEAMMRVTVYAVNGNGAINYVENNQRTYYLYPNQGGSASVTQITETGQGAAANNSLQSVNCGTNQTDFVGLNDYHCNAILKGLPDAAYYLVRFTPLYSVTDVRVQANDNAGAQMSFSRVQYVVDVTARANNAVKRLQARVDGGGTNNVGPDNNSFPEFALRTTNTVCKRLVVQGNNVSQDTKDNDGTTYCNLAVPVIPAQQQAAAQSQNCPAGQVGTPPNNCHAASYTLTVSASGNGSGTVGAENPIDSRQYLRFYYDGHGGTSQSTSLSFGTVVRIGYAPDSDSKFNGFSGCDSTTSNFCMVTMTKNQNVQVKFKVR